MGEVVEVGSASKDKLAVGDRVVIPFTIQCGECDQCKRGNFSVCQRSNRKGQLGDKAFGRKREIPGTCSVECRSVKDVSTKEEVDTWRWHRWAPLGSRL